MIESMANQINLKRLELIQSNISRYGLHINLVSAKTSPRYAYTIGLFTKIGAELILAGAIFYNADEVKRIINEIAVTLKTEADLNQRKIEVGELGSFTLKEVDVSWSNDLMLGVADFYKEKNIRAFQIFPDIPNWTIDVPDLSLPWSEVSAPAWKWLHAPWPYLIPADAIAVTNLAALHGEFITEAARWEEDQWELYAGSSENLTKADVRIVPIGTLLAIDTSLKAVVDLGVGHAIWRDPKVFQWHVWEKK